MGLLKSKYGEHFFSPKKAFVQFRTLVFLFLFFQNRKIHCLTQKKNPGHQVANFHPQIITCGEQTNQILISYYSNNNGGKKKNTS
jgi:hypothetical protein